jgi:excisionase family DNA binding protein
MSEEIPFRDRISCTIDEACKGTGIARTRLYHMIGAGEVEAKKLGRRRLVIVRSLTAALESQSAKAPAAA